MTVETKTPERIDAVEHFEATRAAYMNHKRMYTTMFWVGFLVCLGLSVYHTEFDIFLIIKKLYLKSVIIVLIINHGYIII